jgi:transcriptional regulator with XRE-family HTH domain
VPRPKPALIALSRTALHATQRELADRLGTSLRTVQRWETKRAAPYADQLQRLADAVRPHDPALAAELDEWAPRPPPPPAPAGVAPGSPPPPPPAATALPASVLLDSVVCAAAEAMSAPPQALRPALLAAFVRAREAGLTVEGMIEALTGAPR